MMKLRPRGKKTGDSKQAGNMNVMDSKHDYIANHCNVVFMSTIGGVMPAITLPPASGYLWH